MSRIGHDPALSSPYAERIRRSPWPADGAPPPEVPLGQVIVGRSTQTPSRPPGRDATTKGTQRMYTPLELQLIARAHHDDLLRQSAARRLAQQASGDRLSASQHLCQVLRAVADYLDGGGADCRAEVRALAPGCPPLVGARPFVKAATAHR